MADIKNKNELKRRIELFLDEFTSHEYKINEEFCKETMKMMREFIGHTDNRINVLIAKKEKKDRKIRELQSKSEEVCEWTLIDEDFNAYDTSCRSPWCLESGTPSDNKMNYCPYCGRKIKVVE